MLNVEIKLFSQGKEISTDYFLEAVMREVRASIKREIVEVLGVHERARIVPPENAESGKPREAVSKREGARLLSISTRTLDKYIALKVVRTVRIGKRVLIPMKTVKEVASRGITSRRYQHAQPVLLIALSIRVQSSHLSRALVEHKMPRVVGGHGYRKRGQAGRRTRNMRKAIVSACERHA